MLERNESRLWRSSRQGGIFPPLSILQKPKIDPHKWIEYDPDTKLYDLGRIKIISTTEAIFRAILVDTRQHPLGVKCKVKVYHPFTALFPL